MNQTDNNGRIAGVHVATLLRNLEDSTINEGSHDLYCRCKDAFAVLDSLLGDGAPRAGLYSLLSEEGSRAAGLAEAATLMNTIMADTFKRDDCSEEFLNGMAYGVASYSSAIKALATTPDVATTAMPTDGKNAEVLELHRRLAAEKLRADQGWQRYEAANADRNSLRASMATSVAQSADDVAQTKQLWQSALADAAMYVEAHCVDGERHARHIMEQPLPQIRARGAVPGQAADDLLSALLWLYRRLPRGYGRQEHIEQPIKALAGQTGVDVASDLVERGQHATNSAATLEPSTGVRAVDVAQVLNDLEHAGREGAADVRDIAGRAAAVIKGLLSGLSAAQLSGVGEKDDHGAAPQDDTKHARELEWTRS
ncbi:hypothetical protein GJV26_15925 [Massilia dura]|uniref:Uncharacterized protein n=1 Tax=Pseudoduganella dura TaxID=321982 RepID=A0A6I3XJX2_9BURK|nr:hypothetical protein [Pseudoduganella dura]MUI13931.1 hypothetical protein [Pseudoduganella dura]GGX99018.1 hypothetical protein GCM10007386_32430 [Pseudoduganella dura]